MRSLSANEVIGYFWMFIVLIFVALIWWKVSSILYREEICVLQQGMQCESKKLFSDGNSLKLEITGKNNFGRWIQITGFMCSSEVPDPSIARPQRNFEEMRVNVIPDAKFFVSGTCYRSASDNDLRSFKGIVYLRYEFKDEPYLPGSQVIVGNIKGVVG